jgi:hypothetical protein
VAPEPGMTVRIVSAAAAVDQDFYATSRLVWRYY